MNPNGSTRPVGFHVDDDRHLFSWLAVEDVEPGPPGGLPAVSPAVPVMAKEAL
jgi:hypothetical protein